MDISPEQYYSRQLLLDSVGAAGQHKLSSASVLVVGVGGLGSPMAIYIGASGVGRMGLMDGDDVEVSNLHRQIIHGVDRIGMNKAVSGAKTIANLNPLCNVTIYPYRLSAANGLDIVKQYDVVVDCTDNVTSRYIVNDLCILAGKPMVSAGALRWNGQLFVYNWPPVADAHGPCFRCLHPTRLPPEMTRQAVQVGVMGVCPGMLGMLQAQETLRILLKLKPDHDRTMTLYDGITGTIRQHQIRSSDPNCRACGANRTITIDTVGTVYDNV